MYVNPAIFHAYDVRGEFPEQINAKSAYIIARAFVAYLRGLNPKQFQFTIVVAQDARPSSPELKKAVVEALLEEGVTVVDMGYSTTPFHNFTVVQSAADGGLMITASHDPARMNGLKICRKGGETLGRGLGLEVVQSIAQRSIFQKIEGGSKGTVIEKHFHREYIDFLLKKVDLSKAADIKVVFDAGGGMSSVLLPYLIKRLPCQATILNGDAFFYNDQQILDPSKEVHLANLKNEVLRVRADFGVAFDQDGDRTGFVTKNARFLRPDYAAAYLAQQFLALMPGVSMVYDVRSSNIFRETILAGGGKPLLSRVGHAFIKDLMRKEDAYFGAELSGHFYFKEFFYLDSDFLPFLYFLQFFSYVYGKKTADDILSEFEVYPSSGEISFKIEGKENILEHVAAAFADAKSTQWVDGLSLYYDDWWANVRLSNTEPLARLNIEARTEEILNEKMKTFQAILG